MQVFFRKIAFGLIWCFILSSSAVISGGARSVSERTGTDQGYQLGPEDVLLISVWKDEHLTREVVVRPDGMISFPLVGDVPAEGRTVEELRLDLAKRLIKYIPAVNLTVAVIKPLSYKVYVVGRVAKPGEFLVGHYTDVLQALSLRGD
ncbi:MAG: polysaccharide biosynthesis/export family protein [Nitrospira sp.]|nr:polysaccharide biosynthesis/export family protein [Nitrospira sp.]